MMVLYSPQVSDKEIIYSFDGDIITATIEGMTDVFDFSGTSDGLLQLYSAEPPFEPLFITSLPLMPILSAKRENGVLQVEILRFIGADADENEKYPQWQEV